MADPTYRVELTASFLERLASIEAFLTEADAAAIVRGGEPLESLRRALVLAPLTLAACGGSAPPGATDEEGDEVDFLVKEVRPNTVVVDFNHPLAGKTLHFDVTVREVRAATPEELEHGHVHGGHEHGCGDDCDCEGGCDEGGGCGCGH